MSGMGMNRRGVWWTSIPDGALGLEKWFPDVNLGSSERVKPHLTNSKVLCQLVQNDSGGTLVVASCVKYKAAEWAEEIGATAGAGENADGIVDEYLQAVVPVGYYFWIVRKGLTKAINSTATGIDQGDFLKTAGSGKAVEDSGTPVTNACFGRAAEDWAATADLIARCQVDFTVAAG